MAGIDELSRRLDCPESDIRAWQFGQTNMPEEKFLKLVDIVFGGAVSLGGFVSVTLLIVTLLVSRSAVRRLLYGASNTSA